MTLKKYQRVSIRYRRAVRYAKAGLNGKRAVARRQRQIAAGQLRVTA